MEKLLELAKKVADQAEVYATDFENRAVSFQDAKLKDIQSGLQSGINLRIIKDGKLGFAYTRNLINREELLEDALISLKGQVDGDYDLPFTENLPQLNSYDSNIENLTDTQIVEEAKRVCDLIKSKSNAEVSARIFDSVSKVRIINNKGTDLSSKFSMYGAYVSAGIPASGTGIYNLLMKKSFEPFSDKLINDVLHLYSFTSKTVTPDAGKMKVLFMPGSIMTMNMRLFLALNSQSVYQKISPLADKIGEKIFDEKISLIDNPLNDNYPGARPFDDEGVPCQKLSLVENGVLKSFYYDLNYAKKLNAKSSGHGQRGMASKPSPSLGHLEYQPGDKSLDEMIKMMDRGIILLGVLGPHSGNIPNGDYSVGINPGLYVENGEIVGRVQDAMLAGNIYETLNNVIAVENKTHPSMRCHVPGILCDNVSLSTKK